MRRAIRLGNLCTSDEQPEGNVRAAPHPPFGHLLPQGEGSHDSIPLPPGEGGAKRRVRGRDLCRGSLDQGLTRRRGDAEVQVMAWFFLRVSAPPREALTSKSRKGASSDN